VVYVAGAVLAALLLTPVVVAIIQRREKRKDPLMNGQDTEGTVACPHDTTANKVEDVLRKRTGGTEEHPVEGRADDAQRETPGETRQNQGTHDGEQ